MGEIKQQTLSGVKWTAIERFSIQGVQFLLGIVVARLLTPADYGLVGLLGIFLGISQTLIDSGISNALVRKLDRDEADFSTAFYFNIAVATGCAAAIFFGSPWIAHFFKQPELSPIAKLYSVNLIIGAFGMVQGAKLTIEVDFKTQARINFISAVVSGIICLVLAYLGWGVWSLVWQSIISNVMRVILLWTSTKWKPLLLFSKKSFNNLFGYGSKLMASGLLHTVYSELTTIAIGKFYTPAALGNYYRGQGMSSLPVNMITGMFGRVTFPIFSRIQNDDERLIRVYRNYISSVMMLVVFFVMLIVALAKPLILFLLTDKWSGAIIFVQVYAFAIVFDPICQLNLNLLQVKGRSDLFLRLEIIKKIIATAILFAAIPFGVLAICISKVIYGQIAVIINTYYTGKLFGLGYWKQCKDFLPYFAYSAIACAPAAILAYLCPWHIVSLIVGAISATIIYLAILRICKDTVFMAHIHPYTNKLSKKFSIVFLGNL